MVILNENALYHPQTYFVFFCRMFAKNVCTCGLVTTGVLASLETMLCAMCYDVYVTVCVEDPSYLL